MPYDLRVNDPDKLQERKDAILKEWERLSKELYDADFPDKFYEYLLGNEFVDLSVEDLLSYLDTLKGLGEHITQEVLDKYDENIKEHENNIKDIDKQLKDIDSELKSNQKEEDKLQKEFSKLQKEFLNADDELNQALQNPDLIKEREDTINYIKDLWNSYGMQNPYHYLELEELEGRYDVSIPLSDAQYDRMIELRGKINQDIRLLDNLYKNGAMVNGNEQMLLTQLKNDIRSYGGYIIEPGEFDVDEIASVHGEASIDIPEYIDDLINVPYSVKPLQNKKNEIRDKINGNQDKQSRVTRNREQLSSNREKLKDDKNRHKQSIKELRAGKRQAVNEKKETENMLHLSEYYNSGKDFVRRVNKIRDYQDELIKVNEKLGFNYEDSSIYDGLDDGNGGYLIY